MSNLEKLSIKNAKAQTKISFFFILIFFYLYLGAILKQFKIEAAFGLFFFIFSIPILKRQRK
tara:strand:+ start:675 stop:860 length:186 start_codon:yes stop_codon:yes gene_type:complete